MIKPRYKIRYPLHKLGSSSPSDMNEPPEILENTIKELTQ